MRMRAGDETHAALLDDDEHNPKRSGTLWTFRSKRKWVLGGLALKGLIVLTFLLWPSSSAKPLVIRNGQISMHVLPVGAIIQRLFVPDKNGVLADISLGFDDAEVGKYTDGTSPYFGAVVGRVANRIANATFTLDGRTHHLNRNEGSFPGSLHGGKRGWDKVTWRVQRATESSVLLARHSPAGDEGYPGAVDATVLYELTAANELVIEMRATSDAPTPINMAQHIYFNLGGHESGSVLEHELTLPDATHVLPVDSARIPTGELRPVAGTGFDFLTARPIGSRIAQVDGPGWKARYDNCYVLHGLGAGAKEATRHGAIAVEPPRLAARLVHPPSGRTMEVLTTAPGLQLYTGNFLDGSIRGKGGATYGHYGGVCLETEGFPNAINNPAFPSAVLKPRGEYRHRSIYRFSAQ